MRHTAPSGTFYDTAPAVAQALGCQADGTVSTCVPDPGGDMNWAINALSSLPAQDAPDYLWHH